MDKVVSVYACSFISLHFEPHRHVEIGLSVDKALLECHCRDKMFPSSHQNLSTCQCRTFSTDPKRKV